MSEPGPDIEQEIEKIKENLQELLSGSKSGENQEFIDDLVTGIRRKLSELNPDERLKRAILGMVDDQCQLAEDIFTVIFGKPGKEKHDRTR